MRNRWALALAVLALGGCEKNEEKLAENQAVEAKAEGERPSHLPIIEARIDDDETPAAKPEQPKALTGQTGDIGALKGEPLGDAFGARPASKIDTAEPAVGGAPGRPAGVGPGSADHLFDRNPLDGYPGKTHVVDATGKGDFRTIAAALAKAGSGDRIEVRPGTYTESLDITKPVAIIGKGDRTTIAIEVTGANVLVSKSVRALLENLTLRQAGGEPARYGIDVQSGNLIIERCDITSASLAALVARKGGRIEVRNARIHDSAQSGAFAYEKGELVILASDVVGNGKAGVEVKGTGRLTVKHSYLYDGGASGVFVHGGARATIEESYFTRNRLAGLEVKDGGEADVRRNRFFEGNQSGMFFNGGSRGTIEGNTVRGNGLAGLEIKSGSDPTVRGNSFLGGGQSGIFINTGARGTFEDNTVTGQGLAGIEVKGGDPVVRRNTVKDNKQSGLYIHTSATGLFENNRIEGNGKAGIEINEEASPTIKGNIISRNGYQGIWVLEAGGGTFIGNRFMSNVKGPARIDGAAASRVTGDLPGATGKAAAPIPSGPGDAPSDLKGLIEGTGK